MASGQSNTKTSLESKQPKGREPSEKWQSTIETKVRGVRQSVSVMPLQSSGGTDSNALEQQGKQPVMLLGPTTLWSPRWLRMNACRCWSLESWAEKPLVCHGMAHPSVCSGGVENGIQMQGLWNHDYWGQSKENRQVVVYGELAHVTKGTIGVVKEGQQHIQDSNTNQMGYVGARRS